MHSDILTVKDLDRYLPAIKTNEDMRFKNKLSEGVFLSDAIDGLVELPGDSIDLIITEPSNGPKNEKTKKNFPTYTNYLDWMEVWLTESSRVLKSTGSIYIFCPWESSGMYHSLLSNDFQIQTRITWRNATRKDQPKPMTWINRSSDIWFATKTNEFMFNQEAVTNTENQIKPDEPTELGMTNLWGDIMDIQLGATVQMEGDKPEQLIQRILNASSFKLNWVLDPFTRSGGTGVIAKKMGRRFIGFESDQDRLLMAMKRIDNE